MLGFLAGVLERFLRGVVQPIASVRADDSSSASTQVKAARAPRKMTANGVDRREEEAMAEGDPFGRGRLPRARRLLRGAESMRSLPVGVADRIDCFPRGAGVSWRLLS